MEYKFINPEELNLDYNWAAERRKEAEDLFKSKEHSLCYRGVGRNQVYEPQIVYFEMSDEEKKILCQVQAKHPDEDLAMSLQQEGYEKLYEEIKGDDGFWIEAIDFEHPVSRYQFSIQEVSKHSFRVFEKETVWVNIEDKDYIDLLEFVIKGLSLGDASFNSLALRLPDVYKSIVAQLESTDEDHRKYGDNPYVVFMDEIERDVKSVCGAPSFSCILFYDEQIDEIEVSFKTCGGVASAEKQIKHNSENWNERTGENAIFLSFYNLTSIPSDKLMKALKVDFEEDLPGAVSNLLSYDENCLEELKAFLESNEIPFEYQENGYII